MEGYNKTDKNRLNKITNDNIYDIDPIMENFTLLDDSIGKLSSVNMEGYDEDLEVSSEKSLTNYIKFLWKRLGSIELTDKKVKVTTWANKMLDVVLKELKEKDTEIINTVKEYKTSVDEYSKHLGIYVDMHETANNKLEKLLKGDEAVDYL
ncbi:hypothetical protein [Peptostreptococcus stomatis]|jgi:hypothetical protein|uniref:hypothetical protein n=1 Tax=Peptostreptococcus stomatis TaxID=341694 RepID=UPI0026E9FCCC|nr:hypothetical protein [Peptostreptococcus stomatis]